MGYGHMVQNRAIIISYCLNLIFGIAEDSSHLHWQTRQKNSLQYIFMKSQKLLIQTVCDNTDS